MISAVGQNASSQLLAAPLAGMKRSVAQASDAAQKIAGGEVSPDNFVALMEAEVLFKANRVVATTADSMVGSLFDRRA